MERIKFNVIAFAGLIFSHIVVAQDRNNAASTFLPGIVSIEGNDFNACFSSDGQSFYFTRTIANKSQLHVSRNVNGDWTTPVSLPFCKKEFSYADPAFSPDGELYFISDMPRADTDTTRDFDIWKTSFHNGEWAEPLNVEVLNSPSNEYYISFTSQGNVFFSSSRDGGFGQEDIYTARRSRGTFDVPVNLGPAVNTIHSEYDPFISADGKILFFASSGREDSFGKADLYWVINDGKWREVIHFGSEINSMGRDYCPYFAHDGSFFFSSDGQVKIVGRLSLPGF